MSDNTFNKIISDASIPSTSDEMKTEFKQTLVDNNVVLNNYSDYSPFWRLLDALMITPALWLIDLLKSALMPNMFVKTATGASLDILASGVNLTRRPSSRAIGNITFTRTNTAGVLTVPAGTIIQTPLINESFYQVISTADAIFADGDDSLLVPVEAEAEGSQWNFAANFFTILPTPVAGVTSVTNADDWLTQPGTDLESDDDLRDRCINQFSAVNLFHTDAVYRSIIGEQIGIDGNQIYFDKSAPRGAGSANAYILFDAGVPASEYIDSVNTHIRDEGNHGFGDDLLCLAMPEIMHDLTVDVWPGRNLSTEEESELVTQIEFFIRTAFRESSTSNYAPTQPLPFSRFSFSQLAVELHEEFTDILSVNFSLTDIVSEMSVPKLNSLQVTIQ